MQKHGLWHQTKQVYFQALLLPSKRLCLPEFYLPGEAGTVMAPPRRAVGGLWVTEPAKVVLVHRRVSRKGSCHLAGTTSFFSLEPPHLT